METAMRCGIREERILQLIGENGRKHDTPEKIEENLFERETGEVDMLETNCRDTGDNL